MRKPTKYGTPQKDATVNREMSCLHHWFSKAFEWEMIEQSPFERGKSLMLKENNERVRFLNEAEIQSLLKPSPGYLRNIAICAINTGMRRGEILSLKWNQIRGDFIYLRQTKTKEKREIPINDEMAILFKRIKSEQSPKGKNVVGLNGKPVDCQNQLPENVFTFKGMPVKILKSHSKLL